MRNVRTWILALLACSASLAVVEAAAQPAYLDPQRDCQTVRTCRFDRGGVYRGCLSSYTCRVCRFVRSSCYVDGSRRLCQQVRCTWG
jgi:hypothetical protein